MITSIGEFTTRAEFVYANLGKEEDNILSSIYDFYKDNSLFISEDLESFTVCFKSFFARKGDKYTIEEIIKLSSRKVYEDFIEKSNDILNNFNKLL